MLTKPLSPLCSSGEHWQRRAQLSYCLGRWIINFQISTFCLTAAALPQRKRRQPGWQHVLPKLLASFWSWAVQGCMSLELCLHLHVDVTSFCWQDSSWTCSQHPGEGRWRMLKGAEGCCRMLQPQWLPAVQCAMSRSEGWAGLRCSFVCAVCLIWNQDSFFFFSFVFLSEN